MSELSEEEIIKDLQKYIELINKEYCDECNELNVISGKYCNGSRNVALAIQGLLDLYQKEKQTSHFLQSELDQANAKLIEEKEKNKWKPISEYNREKYDWVLVKYFDGDYECVPEVAEKRSDGKWYTSEREIPFEVKYFFDMQELLEERN